METAERIKVSLGRGRHYTVVRDSQGVIRIEHEGNGVMGAGNLDMTGRTAARVLRELSALEMARKYALSTIEGMKARKRK